jgi:hypothetical protein
LLGFYVSADSSKKSPVVENIGKVSIVVEIVAKQKEMGHAENDRLYRTAS